jgi:hypothetical protein
MVFLSKGVFTRRDTIHVVAGLFQTSLSKLASTHQHCADYKRHMVRDNLCWRTAPTAVDTLLTAPPGNNIQSHAVGELLLVNTRLVTLPSREEGGGGEFR